MGNRTRRGGAAAMYASRMTEQVTAEEDEPRDDIVVDEPADENDDDLVVTEEEPDDDPASLLPDYSHLGEDEPEPDDEPKDDAVEVLRAQLAELQGKNAELQTKAADGEIAQLAADASRLSHALSVAQTALQAATAAAEEAASKADWKSFAKHQQDIAAATLDVREFGDAAEQISREIEQRKRQPRPQQTTTTAPAGDPFDQFVAQTPPNTQTWLKKNKADLTKSQARGKLAEAGHFLALEKGLALDSPEYIAFLDKHMGYEGEPMPKPKTTNGTRKPAGRAQTAAPAGGRTRSPGAGVSQVTLSKAEVEMAKTMGLTTKEYAANKAELIKNGNDPSRSGPRYSQQSQANRR